MKIKLIQYDKLNITSYHVVNLIKRISNRLEITVRLGWLNVKSLIL